MAVGVRVTLVCSGRGTHEPVVVYRYEGPLPWPEDFSPRPRGSEFSLLCEESKGGCGRDIRPGDARLRQLVNAIADTPTQAFDVSYWIL